VTRRFWQSRSAAFLAVACALSTVSHAQSDPLVFRSATSLVRFTLVARDGSGRPVTDLTKEEIEVFEDGRPRQVAFLQYERGAMRAEPVDSLPAGVFSNRSQYTPGPPRSVTAIVLDAVNTAAAQQAVVNGQVLKHLAVIAPASRIALYRLSTHVEVLHDFTEDLASLRARIARNDIRLQPSTVDRGNDVDGLAKNADEDRRQFIAEVVAAERRQATPYNLEVRDRRMAMTLGGLEVLGDHLAGIPGRKNLVWISAAAPMLEQHEDLRKSYASFLRATAERLATEGIAIYSVDANGLVGADLGTSSTTPGVSRTPSLRRNVLPSRTAEGRLWASMDALSGITGGRVIKFSNDPTKGIDAAETDADGAYSIAFHAAATPDDGWHKLKVATGRRGVSLLHREGYMARAAGTPRSWSTGDWRLAAATPLASTALRMDASAAVNTGVLTLLVQVPFEDLQVAQTQTAAHADLDVGLAEKHADGVFRIRHEPTVLRVEATNSPARPRPLLQFAKQWELDKRATAIRLIIRDRLTGRYGVLDVPLRLVPQA
jgi:VWFA-related protein